MGTSSFFATARTKDVERRPCLTNTHTYTLYSSSFHGRLSPQISFCDPYPTVFLSFSFFLRIQTGFKAKAAFDPSRFVNLPTNILLTLSDRSPEKDCCSWLTFRQPVREPSSESRRIFIVDSATTNPLSCNRELLTPHGTGMCRSISSRSLTREDENGSGDIDISFGYRRRGSVSYGRPLPPKIQEL